MVSSTTTDQLNEIELEFSNDAIAIESGQPVFTKDTKIWLSNPSESKVKLYINEEEKEIDDSIVDVSDLTKLEEGTYTLMAVKEVDNKKEEIIFGFTIQ